MHPDLQRLPNIWRAHSLSIGQMRHIPSGHAELDAALGGGWPAAALIELLCDKQGIGELQLLLPILKYFQQAERNPLVLWLNPPHHLHAIALLQQGLDPSHHWVIHDLSAKDVAWAMERGLKSRACVAVVGWLSRAAPATLRRIKLAAMTTQTCGVIFRPTHAGHIPSPANIRAKLDAHAHRLEVNLLKIQGRLPCSVVLDVGSRIDQDIA